MLHACRKVYGDLVDKGVIKPAPEWNPPEVPLDLDKAVKTGKASSLP